MRSAFAVLVALVVVAAAPIGVAAASGVPAAASGLTQIQDGGVTTQTTAGDTATESDGTNETNPTNATAAPGNGSATSLAPGAQLAAVVGVQQTEIGSEVENRAFGQRIAAAESNASKAAIVAGSLDDSRERLTELRSQLDELEAARENGTVSEGRYRARAAQLSARINAVERSLDAANETASGLPAQVREENGINVSNIERLRGEARNLSGPEVAAIAREVAGENPGRGMGGPPESAGPPEDAGASDRSDDAPGRNGDRNETGEAPGNGQGPSAGGSESASDGENGAPGQSGNAGSSGNGAQPEDRGNADDRNSEANNGRDGASDRGDRGNGGSNAEDSGPESDGTA